MVNSALQVWADIWLVSFLIWKTVILINSNPWMKRKKNLSRIQSWLPTFAKARSLKSRSGLKLSISVVLSSMTRKNWMQFIQDLSLVQPERSLVIKKMPVYRNGDATSLAQPTDRKFCKKLCDGLVMATSRIICRSIVVIPISMSSNYISKMSFHG